MGGLVMFALYADTDTTAQTVIDGNLYEAIIAAEALLENGVSETIRVYNLNNSRVVWIGRRAFITDCNEEIAHVILPRREDS
jgi:hypothetical protein